MKKIIPQAARDVLQDVANRHGLNPEDVTNKGGRKHMLAQIEVAKVLESRGYSGSRIGEVVQRDPTTVYFYLGRIRNKYPKRIQP